MQNIWPEDETENGAENDPRMVREWHRAWSENGLGMIREWSENGLRMVREWSENGLRMVPRMIR